MAEWLIGLARTVPPASVAQPPASLDVVRVVVFGEVVWGARFRDPDLEHPQGPGSSWVVWGDDFGQSLVPDQVVTSIFTGLVVEAIAAAAVCRPVFGKAGG